MVGQETQETDLKESNFDKSKTIVSFDYHSSRFFSLLFLAIYIVAITVFCLEYKIIPGPEFLVLGILFIAAYNNQRQESRLYLFDPATNICSVSPLWNRVFEG